MQLEFCKKHVAVLMILLPDRGQKCIASAVTSGVGGGGGAAAPPGLKNSEQTRKLFKILNIKKYTFNTVNSGHTLSFRASTSCTKILNVNSIFNTVKIFKANSVFRASTKLLKYPVNGKKYVQCSDNFQGKLSFSVQALVVQNSEW